MENIQIKQFLYEFFLLCGKYGVKFYEMTFIADSEIYRYRKNSDDNFVLYHNDDVEIIDISDYHYLSIDDFTKALNGEDSSDIGYVDDIGDIDDIDFC